MIRLVEITDGKEGEDEGTILMMNVWGIKRGYVCQRGRNEQSVVKQTHLTWRLHCFSHPFSCLSFWTMHDDPM